MSALGIIVCLRDPDYDNEFHVFGANVVIHDIDLGRSDLRDPESLRSWSESHLDSAKEFREQGNVAAAVFIEEVVANQQIEED